jgi:hypothetical protein
VSAQRFKLTDAQRAKPPHPFRYLALYEIETNDLQKTLDELGKRSGTPAMVLTDTMAPGTQAHIYEAITPVVTPKRWSAWPEQRFGPDRWSPEPVSPSIAVAGRRVGRA